jgi:NADH-quinone oxidoreductase subunit L
MTTTLPAAMYATLPLWPLLGAAVVGLFIALRRKANLAHWPVVLGVALSAALGVTLFLDLAKTVVAQPHSLSGRGQGEGSAVGPPPGLPREGSGGGAPAHYVPGLTYLVYNWISLGQETSQQAGQWLSVNFYFDGLTAVMLLFVTVVSLMVIVYSIGYMRDHHGLPERGYERFFAFLGLFVFSMCVLVLAGNFVLLYLGWELVGLCSYLLIGFYYPRPAAATAAKKAFIVNRVGDFGFAVGIFALYWFITSGPTPLAQPGENPLDYAVVFKHVAAGSLTAGQLTLVALLLTCGAIGKSAQFPLHVWLPDAMEGPTPVSALIHAATMVTAGVYMIARCTPLYAGAPVAQDVVLAVGLVGAVLAATMACAQFDMKRILAYSTISQLAFMFVGLGCRAPDSAVFHVFTHAWFKALLFLGAGCVMHALGGVIDLRRFSGLRHVLPRTYRLMLVGCLALAGFPLLSGFWSKDEIVHAAFVRAPWVGGLLLATAGLTAYYTFRMFFLCFHGRLRLPDEAGQQPHDAPAVMIAPLWVLALGAIFAGYIGVSPGGGPDAFLGVFRPHGRIHECLAGSTLGHAEPAPGGAWVMYASTLVALAGIALAWRRYGAAPETDPDQRALGGLWRLWHDKYYFDEVYDRLFVRPLRGVGRVCFGTDNYGVDSVVWLVAAVPRGLAHLLHFLQRGAVQAYALSMVVGVAVLLLIWSWFLGA